MTPISEVVDNRNTRTNRWAVYADGRTVQSGRSQIVTDAGFTAEMAWIRLGTNDPLPANMPTYPVLVIRT